MKLHVKLGLVVDVLYIQSHMDDLKIFLGMRKYF